MDYGASFQLNLTCKVPNMDNDMVPALLLTMPHCPLGVKPMAVLSGPKAHLYMQRPQPQEVNGPVEASCFDNKERALRARPPIINAESACVCAYHQPFNI